MSETIKIEVRGGGQLVDELRETLKDVDGLKFSEPHSVVRDDMTRAPIDLGVAIQVAKLVAIVIQTGAAGTALWSKISKLMAKHQQEAAIAQGGRHRILKPGMTPEAVQQIVTEQLT